VVQRTTERKATVQARNNQIGKSSLVCRKPVRRVAIVRSNHPTVAMAVAISAAAMECGRKCGETELSPEQPHNGRAKRPAHSDLQLTSFQT